MSAAPSLSALLERRLAGLPPRTTCFRWVDGERGDQATVDLFGPVAVLSLYAPRPPEAEAALAEALAAARPLTAVYLKRRPREARQAGLAAAEVAPAAPVWGQPVPTLVAEERGARFEIRPPNGLSVGLYLDARDARAWVEQEARGRRVLNTFAYTCGFAVAALKGGARGVLNVDLSRKVLDWGRANLALNGLAAAPEDFRAGEVAEWARRLRRREERFELVVLDPPGSASAGGRRFSAARDYHALVAALAPLVAPGGLLLAMCNVESLTPAAFDAQLLKGLQGRPAREVARFGASPVDFAAPSALKCRALALR